MTAEASKVCDAQRAPLQSAARPNSSGGVAERLIAPVLKTGRPKGLVSSNLTPSADSALHLGPWLWDDGLTKQVSGPLAERTKFPERRRKQHRTNNALRGIDGRGRSRSGSRGMRLQRADSLETTQQRKQPKPPRDQTGRRDTSSGNSCRARLLAVLPTA